MPEPRATDLALLGAGDAAELSARLRVAALEGRPVVVLDPAWPEPLRAAAMESVQRAGVAGDRLVLFTSGSSGRPRGVVRTVASWEASIGPLSQITGIGAGDIVWLPGSATSTLTLYGGWHALAVGARVVGGDDWPRSAPPGVSALHATPRLLESVVSAAEHGLFPAVRVAVSAGAPLRPGLRARAEALGWRLVDYYGAAELSFVAWRADHAAYQPFPGVDVDLRDQRIWVRSAYVAESYLDPDDPGPLTHDGEWATVGDLGRLDDTGLTVLGRADQAVTTGGRTVVVEDVERSLLSAGEPRIGDVAVSSIPHPLLGELLVAVVEVAVIEVAPDAAGLTRADLDRAAEGVPDWSIPRRWWLVDRLPRTAAGKVDRVAVRAGIADGSLTPRPLR